ncbi:MAG: phosphate acyltransferase PlsX [Phycisphaerae bacterium]|nr:phosphate acyltransferase PlsX [Phycisphaerae bacterium]
MRIGLDAMGGDFGPKEVVSGALAAREYLSNGDVIVLVGREDVVREHLGEQDGCDGIEVYHAEQEIGMGESPVDALRTKPKSSIAVMTALHRHGELDACISAGNTGACVAAAQMGLRRLKGVHRPGISVLAPTFGGPLAICDCGANVNCRPLNLYQYGVMTSVYMKAVCDVATPRVGLLSVGEEESKGNSLVKKTSELLRADSRVNFVGNVEGNDLLRDVMDVMICDGFVGNVVLKLVEGLGFGLIQGLHKQLSAAIPEQKGRVDEAFGTLARKYDFNQYGGAPLLGVDGIWFICHGASTSCGIKNAVREAIQFAKRGVNQQITEQLTGR